MFHKKVIEERKKLNMTQNDLAKLMNVTKTTIDQWESGVTMPNLDNVLRLSEIFNVTTDYLLKDIKSDSEFSFYTKEAIKVKKTFSYIKLAAIAFLTLSLLALFTLLVVSSIEPIIVEYNGREIGGILAYCLSSSNFLVGTIFILLVFVISLILVIIPDRILIKKFLKK